MCFITARNCKIQLYRGYLCQSRAFSLYMRYNTCTEWISARATVGYSAQHIVISCSVLSDFSLSHQYHKHTLITARAADRMLVLSFPSTNLGHDALLPRGGSPAS